MYELRYEKIFTHVNKSVTNVQKGRKCGFLVESGELRIESDKKLLLRPL
jgi:hypothetical protein